MNAYLAKPPATVCTWRLLIGAVFSVCAIEPALSQPTPYETKTPYETPLYRPSTSSLEPNYGVPSLGLPGSELPKQRTMAPERTTSTAPDFLTSLGARSKADEDADDLTKRTKLRTSGETPDATTPDSTMDEGRIDRQQQVAPD